MENQVISNPTKPNFVTVGLAAEQDPLGLIPLPTENRERFLRFTLAKKNNFLLPLTQILEVMQLPLTSVLPVPNMPPCVLGLCSWQGKTLWLVDLNTLAGYAPLVGQSPSMPSVHPSCRQFPLLPPPVVIVVQYESRSLGLVVEQVGDVDLIEPATIQIQSGLCPPALEPFVLGYCPRTEGRASCIVLNSLPIVTFFRDLSPD